MFRSRSRLLVNALSSFKPYRTTALFSFSSFSSSFFSSSSFSSYPLFFFSPLNEISLSLSLSSSSCCCFHCVARAPFSTSSRKTSSFSFSSSSSSSLSSFASFSSRPFSSASSSSPSSSSSPPSCPVSSSPYAPLSPSLRRSSTGLYHDSSLPRTFDKILIANRGEIACRIIRSCQLLGVKTVTIYSEADRDARHVAMADQSFCVGPPPAAESYLQAEKIIAVAQQSGAQAIHPGYGFMSENADFARQVIGAGLKWIGPPPRAIELMGSKSASKALMHEAKVPIVPGYHGEKQDDLTLQNEAQRVGYPLMLKAVMGGGGKGMRIVRKPEELLEALAACRREALKSFKDERVLLERYIERSRHIEFQIFADLHGHCVHLYERDCSVQRRHQKVLEEAPAFGLSDEQRAAMGAQAINAALAVGYSGAGTVEFIVDADTNEYYFMEMNTRLQVEHPVTEMIVRRDLVQWQLHVAANFELPCQQSNIIAVGHAIEARIYAEKPEAGFLPAAGMVFHLSSPAMSENIRVESAIRAGDAIGIFYDPMIAKLVAWGATRRQAIENLTVALRKYEITGVETNVAFLIRCCENEAFLTGGVDTSFISRHSTTLLRPEQGFSPQAAALAALWMFVRQRLNEQRSVWSSSQSWRLFSNSDRSFPLEYSVVTKDSAKTQRVTVQLRLTDRDPNASVSTAASALISHETFALRVAEQQFEAVLTSSDSHDDSQIACTLSGQACHGRVIFDDQCGVLDVFVAAGEHARFVVPIEIFERSGTSSTDSIISPMAGRIVKVSATVGQRVKMGDALVIMEAMKMEHVIRASRDAIIETIAAKEGQFVEGGKALASFSKVDEK